MFEIRIHDAPALYELSLLYQKQGDFNLALEKINKAISLIQKTSGLF